MGKPAATAIDHVWRSDLTYIETGEGWLYLCAFKDACSRRLVGWAMSEKIDTQLVLSALEMRAATPAQSRFDYPHRPRLPVRQRSIPPEASRDGRDSQHEPPRQLLRQRRHGIGRSILKLECVYRRTFATRADARAHLHDLHDYLCFYNRERLHSSLGYLSPLDYESLLP